MIREANLLHRKFSLLPMVGDVVITTAPVSVLKRQNAEEKVFNRLKDKDEASVFAGVLVNMEKEDVCAFLSEQSKKMEKGMANVLAQNHGAGPKQAPSVKPSLAARARGPAPLR